MFFLALTNSIGGFEQIVPDASLDDGKFTLIVVKTSNLIEILQLITMVLNGGKHVNDPRILYVKTSKLVAKPVDEKMMINVDGEYGGDAPMTFKNHRQHLEIFANTDEIPDEQARANISLKVSVILKTLAIWNLITKTKKIKFKVRTLCPGFFYWA